MKGVEFPEQTTVYGKPKGWKEEDCYGLPVSQAFYGNSDGNGVCCLISCWQLTPEEMEEVKRTGKIYLSITGSGMPPVSLYTENPFSEDYDKARALEIHRRIAQENAEGRQINLNNL